MDDALNGKDRFRRRPLGIVNNRLSAEQLRDALGRLGLLPEEQVWDDDIVEGLTTETPHLLSPDNAQTPHLLSRQEAT